MYIYIYRYICDTRLHTTECRFKCISNTGEPHPQKYLVDEGRETGHTHKHTTRTTQHTTRQEQHYKRPHEEPISLKGEAQHRSYEYAFQNE